MAPLRGRRSRGTRPPTWWSSEAAIRGCGLPGTCSIRSRASGSSCSRATYAATAPAGGTADSASRSGSARRALRERFGDEAGARAARRLERDRDRDRRVVRGQRRGRLVRPVRATCASRPARPSTTWASTRSRPPRRWASRMRCTPCPRSRCASAWTRRSSAAACWCPTSRPCSRRGSRWACAPGCSSAASRSSRTRGCVSLDAGGSVAARDGRRVGARQGRRARRGPVRALVPPAPLAAVGDLLPHRPHRAGARRARGDRLDRRRVHHRRPHAPPLLPHHARRPDRVRLGRRPARLRQPHERPDRGGPRRRRRGAPPPAPDLPRPRGPPRSRTPGAARSTCRRATSPRSARCPAGPCTSRSASPATASGPTHLAGRALASLALDRRDRWTSLPLVGSERGRLGAAGAARLAGREPRPRRASYAARRPTSAASEPGPLTRAMCAVPKALGIHVAR